MKQLWYEITREWYRWTNLNNVKELIDWHNSEIFYKEWIKRYGGLKNDLGRSS